MPQPTCPGAPGRQRDGSWDVRGASSHPLARNVGRPERENWLASVEGEIHRRSSLQSTVERAGGLQVAEDCGALALRTTVTLAMRAVLWVMTVSPV